MIIDVLIIAVAVFAVLSFTVIVYQLGRSEGFIDGKIAAYDDMNEQIRRIGEEAVKEAAKQNQETEELLERCGFEL